MSPVLRASLQFSATALSVIALGLGALWLRPSPGEWLEAQGQEVVGVSLGCAKTDRWIAQHEGDPDVVIVAYNPTEFGGDKLCRRAVARLPYYWQLTPAEACASLVEHAVRAAVHGSE